MEFVSKIVEKEFKGFGVFKGVIESFDASTGFFRIAYEDGDSEEVDLAEVNSLVHATASAEIPFQNENVKRKVGRKPKKRHRMRGDPGNGTDNLVDNSARSTGHLEGDHMVARNSNCSMSVNKNLDSIIGSGNNGLDLNRVVNSDDGLVFGDASLANVCGIRGGIDLNFTADNSIDDKLVVETDCFGTETKKREHDFDLNSAINDEDLMLGCEDEDRLINVPVQIIESKISSPLDDTQKIVVEIICLGNDIDQVQKDSAAGSLKANQNRNSFVAGITAIGGLPAADIDTFEVRIGEGQSDAVTPSTSGDAAGGHRKRKNVLEDDSLLKSVLRRSARRARASQNNKSGTKVKDEANKLTSPGSNVVSEGRSKRQCFEGVQHANVLPPMVELPPSSSNMSLDGIPASDLFSVYAFLRSFSTFLFLSPFELEDLVEAVKSTVAHLLLDHIHLSILKTLRPHLQFLVNEGSESASTCLRSLNWDLLDEITWPLFMVEYLLFHGSGFEPGFSVGDLKLVDCEYYKQPAKLKMQLLRCLCDDVLEVEGIRLELNKRMTVANLNVYFDRNSNYDASKRRRASTDSSRLSDDFANEAADWNSDECCLCKMDGSLICCDGCPAAYHARCVGVASSLLPEGDWYCPECMIGKGDNGTQPHRLVRGAELLGSDPYGCLYYSCCGYLLVSTISDAESSFRYYQRNDLSTVVQVLQSSGSIYDTIISAISRHWSVGADSDQPRHNLNPTLPICFDVTGFLVQPKMIDEAMDGGKHSKKMEDLNSSDGTAEAVQAGKGIQISNNPRVDSDGDLGLKAASVPGKHRKRGRPVGSYRKTSLIKALVRPKMREELMNGEKHSKTTENLVTSSEGSAESVQGGKGIQNFNNPRVDSGGYLGIKAADVPAKRRKRGRPVGSHRKTSPAKGKEEEILQLQGRTCYMNCYSFARTASSVVEELTRKTSNKSNEALLKSEEEIIAAQMKIILKLSTRVCWPTIENLTVEIQKEKCGWCYSCRSPVEDRDCLFNMCNAYSVPEDLKREGSGLQPKRSKKGHLVDLICCLLSVEERLQGLLLGPWLSPNYSKLWRKKLLKASDLASVKYHLLTLESNLNHLAFSAEWWKHVDSAVRMGSAFHIVIHSRQSIKHGINQRRVRCANPGPTLNAAGGLSMFWWRGGKISRKLFNWKALPHSWALKCARKGGSIKIPDILYVDGSEYAKRSQQVVWRAAVENTTCTEQLALQMREFDLHIKWDDIENTHLQPNLNNETKKSLRLFKKVIIRRARVEGTMVKYLLDFGKRRSIPKVVMRHGAMIEEPSSERKKYWLEESKVPLHLLKTFEGKRIARRAGKRNSSKVLEDSKVMKKPIKRHDFQYLFSRAERPENHECGHCKKNVPIRDAVSCQYCNGFFHKRHVRRSSMSVTAECIYTCHRCQAGKHTETHRKRGGIKLRKVKNAKSVRSVGGGRKMKSKRGRKPKAIVGQASSKKGRKVRVQVQPSVSQGKVQVQLSTSQGKVQVPSTPQGKVQVQLSTSQGKVQVPSTPQGNTSTGVALRRSARTAKHIALQYDELAGGKKRSQRKSRSVPSKKSTQDSSLRKKRRQRVSTFWKNGLLLSRKRNDERVTSFKRRKLVTASESSMGIGDQPKCLLCHEEGYTSVLKYIACELCGGWFHADAFGLEAENIKCLIGFRCHICRQRKPPVCPYVGYKPSNWVQLSELAKGGDAIESPEELCEAVIISKETNANSHNHSDEDSQACSQAPMMDIELSVENGYMPCTDDPIIDGSQNCNGNLDAGLNARSRENLGLDNIAESAKHLGTHPEAV